MNRAETLQQLAALGNEKVRARNRKLGAGDEQFGVQMGDLRKVAAKIKKDHALALELWETGNLDARLLAVLVLEPRRLAAAELEAMVRAATFAWLADWLNAYVVKEHPEKEALRQRWMAPGTAREPTGGSWLARAGWSLTSGRIHSSPEGLDLPALLDRIESEMPLAPPETQWTMNNCLAGIGIQFSEHRERALAIGEKLGIFRDYPVGKGCTSPFAPIWIREMVRRKN